MLLKLQARRIVKARRRQLWVGAVLFLAVVPLWPQDKKDSPAAEPEVVSIFPLGGERGATLNAEIRGNTLDGAYAVWFDAEGVKAQVTKLEVVEGAHREYQFADFIHAFGFMATAAIAIEKVNHHPEWFNVYNRVTVDLTTHDAGGITSSDTEMAATLEAIASKLMS